ncbi:aspartate/glutamate racemase family protein [Acinetobacter sp. MD2(2019)]|uniref:aspartate/glutamate racemase family protein n=1 Tax=Acinetobacter sp. MD2(2019) TaxID=2605273 RepID=UPI002D1F6814|nr:aspartate/glutamate racemase family protein [Acinetobacter sp. MD2(2019)]MEB3754626.1 aspartate/glutamate racemase family protein [Acinetobacter sp. MD2(2019)]
MKTIGLLGGMSWESSALYYQKINQHIHAQLGGLHSAKLILLSVDFAYIEELQKQALWEQAGHYLAEQAQKLVLAGADCIVLCTNTMHKVAATIEAAISIPFLHIADATALNILHTGCNTVGLLGTAFTMEQDFYRARLEEQGIQVLIPNAVQRKVVHDVIYNELCLGQVNAASKQQYIEIVEDLISKGAQGIILGCTEICMLIGDVNFSVPTFDTTTIHAQAAVNFALIDKVKTL